MKNFKILVKQIQGQWKVLISNGEESRLYMDAGVKSVAVHAARVLRSGAKLHPNLLELKFEAAA